MRKVLSKFLFSTLVLVLLVGIATPVSARPILDERARPVREWRTPDATSFEFVALEAVFVDFQINSFATNAMVSAILSDGIIVESHGVVVAEDLAFSMYLEFDLEILHLGINLPFSLWLDVDVTDLYDPTILLVAELPLLLRAMLFDTAFHSAASRPYYVLDLSDVAARLFADIEASIVNISPEYLAEFYENLAATLVELWEEIRGYVDVYEFEFDYSVSDEDGSIFTELIFGVIIDDGIDFVDFGFASFRDTFNINNAERVPLPSLTDYNSVDLLELLLSSRLFR
jgi:hypothetical protein